MQRWILDAVKPPDGWLVEPQPIAASWGVGDRAHEGLFHVYVLRLADGALYIGQTKDVDARVRAHTEGRGARITTKNQPVSLVHSAAVKTRQAAVDAERLLRDAMRRAGMRVSMGEDPDKSEALVTA